MAECNCPTRSLVHKIGKKLPHFPTDSKSICSIYFLSKSLLPSPVNYGFDFALDAVRFCPASHHVGCSHNPLVPGLKNHTLGQTASPFCLSCIHLLGLLIPCYFCSRKMSSCFICWIWKTVPNTVSGFNERSDYLCSESRCKSSWCSNASEQNTQTKKKKAICQFQAIIKLSTCKKQ